MEVMIESLHHVIDQLAGILLALLGQVEIEHGGFETSVAHIALDDVQIDAGFEQMGGVGMAQGVNRNTFFTEPGTPLGLAKGTLDTAFGHGMKGLMDARSGSAESREEKAGMAVGTPIMAQQMKRRLRQRDIAVLGALAAVDVDHHALTVDIGDFEVEAFVKAQTAGVHGGKIDVVVEGFDVSQNATPTTGVDRKQRIRNH
jgi:hypothetical protein